MTLGEFLAARLDEDEAAAHRAAEWIERASQGGGGSAPGNSIAVYTNGMPERQFREVEAKRKILAEHKAVIKLADLTEQELGFLGWYREWVLKNLAAVYAGHPDYDEAWRP